jgi:hypothetical protein
MEILSYVAHTFMILWRIFSVFIYLLVRVSLTTLTLELSTNNVLESTRTEAPAMLCKVIPQNLAQGTEERQKTIEPLQLGRQRSELATTE